MTEAGGYVAIERVRHAAPGPMTVVGLTSTASLVGMVCLSNTGVSQSPSRDLVALGCNLGRCNKRAARRTMQYLPYGCPHIGVENEKVSKPIRRDSTINTTIDTIDDNNNNVTVVVTNNNTLTDNIINNIINDKILLLTKRGYIYVLSLFIL
jgi:hypothetical protein